MVRMAGGNSKRADEIHSGDIVATPDGPRRVELVTVDRLSHPIEMCIG
eukprot:COSAG06_NODE_55075_length_291_cov_0.875000_1_plen_47_part_01